jgi:hypothetical protein
MNLEHVLRDIQPIVVARSRDVSFAGLERARSRGSRKLALGKPPRLGKAVVVEKSGAAA